MKNTTRRHGNHVRVKPGVTATEGMDGNMPTLTIRKNGRIIAHYRGSSLGFSDPLTPEDCEYLQSLIPTEENI